MFRSCSGVVLGPPGAQGGPGRAEARPGLGPGAPQASVGLGRGHAPGGLGDHPPAVRAPPRPPPTKKDPPPLSWERTRAVRLSVLSTIILARVVRGTFFRHSAAEEEGREGRFCEGEKKGLDASRAIIKLTLFTISLVVLRCAAYLNLWGHISGRGPVWRVGPCTMLGRRVLRQNPPPHPPNAARESAARQSHWRAALSRAA